MGDTNEAFPLFGSAGPSSFQQLRKPGERQRFALDFDGDRANSIEDKFTAAQLCPNSPVGAVSDRDNGSCVTTGCGGARNRRRRRLPQSIIWAKPRDYGTNVQYRGFMVAK